MPLSLKQNLLQRGNLFTGFHRVLISLFHANALFKRNIQISFENLTIYFCGIYPARFSERCTTLTFCSKRNKKKLRFLMGQKASGHHCDSLASLIVIHNKRLHYRRNQLTFWRGHATPVTCILHLTL